MAKVSSAREDMLSAATELFRARGYEGVGVAELLEASGAPRGSLYFHFPGGKEQIGVEVIARVAEAVLAQFKGLGQKEVDLNTYIDTVFKHTAKTVKERDFGVSCPIAVIAGESSTAHSPELTAAVARAFKNWETEISRFAETRGMTVKNAAEFASTLVGSMEGAFLLSKVQRSTAPHTQAARALKALAATMVSPN